MVWYGMVWYGMVWYGMVWYGMVWYGIYLQHHLCLTLFNMFHCQIEQTICKINIPVLVCTAITPNNYFFNFRVGIKEFTEVFVLQVCKHFTVHISFCFKLLSQSHLVTSAYTERSFAFENVHGQLLVVLHQPERQQHHQVIINIIVLFNTNFRKNINTYPGN